MLAEGEGLALVNGRLRQGLGVLQRAAAVAARCANNDGGRLHASVLYRIAFVYAQLENARESQRATDAGLAIARRLNDPLLKSTGLRRSAEILMRTAPDDAFLAARVRPLLAEALDLAETGAPSLVGVSLHLLATLDRQMGQIESAIGLYRRAVKDQRGSGKEWYDMHSLANTLRCSASGSTEADRLDDETLIGVRAARIIPILLAILGNKHNVLSKDGDIGGARLHLQELFSELEHRTPGQTRNLKCPICLGEEPNWLTCEKPLYVAPSCYHVYHNECFMQCLETTPDWICLLCNRRGR